MVHAQITVKPFGGSKKEEFNQFQQLFRGYVKVAAFNPLQQKIFLHFHLRDNAIRFQFTEASQKHLNLRLDALQKHFCNLRFQELLMLKLERENFDAKKGTPQKISL